MTPDTKLALGFAVFYVFGLGVMSLTACFLRGKGAKSKCSAARQG